MHNHNSNKDGGHKGMMWMMIPCFLLLGFLFLGGGKLSSGGYLWPILIGAMVAAHLWMMFRGHGSHGDHHADHTENHTEQNVAEAGKAEPAVHEKKDHSCCQ